MTIVLVKNSIGKEQQCKTRNCFGWKFNLKEDQATCLNCQKVYHKNDDEEFGPFPRAGSELVDELNHLQRFAFLKSSDGQSIIKAPMSSGSHVDEYDVMIIAERYQSELNDLRNRLAQYENMEKRDV